jgi:hypothetical protein
MTQSLKFRFKLIKAAVLCSLLLVVIFTACSKSDSPPPPPPDKSALQDTITTAQSLYDATVEGTKPGQYEVGSRTALKTAIDAANAVLADASATQQQITSAAANLHAAMVTYAGHYITEISAANLIGFWKMNGNPNDSSGNNNNGVLTQGHPYYGAGNATPAADRFGRSGMCYHFDNGGNIEVPYTTALNPQQMSISLWCKKSPGSRVLNADTYTLVALNRWNGYKVQYQSANKIFFTVKGTNGTDTSYYDRDDETAVLDNEVWYHVIVTFKPGEMNFYINGDLVKSWTNTPFAAISLAAPINFVIGQDLPTSKYLTVDGDFQVAWGGFFSGDIDDVMFYNISLTGPQAKSIFENQKTL